MQELLIGTPPALKGSPLDITNEFFPKDPVERWCRSYLSSALEHLGMWADLVAPMKLHPEAELHHTPRPAQTLARAALESASQAVWILAASTPGEMARRHMSLVLDDWDQQKKAAIDPDMKASLKARRDEVIELLKPAELNLRVPTYLKLVTDAAAEVRDNLSAHGLSAPADVERLWRASAASAGSAHGKMWPAIELRVSMVVEGRSYRFPDPTAMSAMLVLAEKVTSYGVARFIDRAGHEPELGARLEEAARSLYRRVPKIPGAPEMMPDSGKVGGATA
jgi:hypothetical protein